MKYRKLTQVLDRSMVKKARKQYDLKAVSVKTGAQNDGAEKT